MQKKKIIHYSITILFLVLFDQVSKIFLINYLKNKVYHTLELLPFLDFIYAWNYGISFGLFQDSGDIGRWVIAIFALFIVIFLAVWLRKEQHAARLYCPVSYKLRCHGLTGSANGLIPDGFP